MLSCPSEEPAGDGTGRLSYFNEGDLEMAGGHLGHLDEESRLVAVVFDDVVVHVDENPGERRGGQVRRRAQNMGGVCSQVKRNDFGPIKVTSSPHANNSFPHIELQYT